MSKEYNPVYLIVLWTEGHIIGGSRYIMDAFVYSDEKVANWVFNKLVEMYGVLRVEKMRAHYDTIPHFLS
ncbi:MAG: hypothetical protein ACOYXO_08600 [Chloroflexota bacterium]